MTNNEKNIKDNFFLSNKFREECENILAKEKNLSKEDKELLLEEAKKYGFDEIADNSDNNWR